MKNFWLSLRIIGRNWVALLYFEIIYKIFGFTVVFAYVQYLMSLLPGLAGIDYIGLETIGMVLKSPIAVLLGLGILVLAALYVVYEIAALFLIAEKGWHNERISLIQLGREAAFMTVRLLRPAKIGVFLMIPILMFSMFSPVSRYLRTIRFPEFILEFIKENTALYGIYIFLIALFHILLLMYIFGLPAMLFFGRSFKSSWHESLGMLRGRKIRTAVSVILQVVSFILLYLSVTALFVWGLGIHTKRNYDDPLGVRIFQLHLTGSLRIAEIVGSTMAASFLCALIIVLYHQYRGDVREKAGKKKRGVVSTIYQLISAFALIIILGIFSETEVGGNMFPERTAVPVIIAHRGGAAMAPENTRMALVNAVADGADGAEIDVQQLGDGTLIIMHDTNFKRTAGVDLDVWEADKEMIQGMNAAYNFKREKVEEPVPLLEDMLKEADGKIRLMIELKANGHEKELEQDTVHLIRQYGMEKQCMIASMDMDVLRQMKKLAPELETVYISAILITDRYDLDFVDGYSVETTSLSAGMVLQAHFQGKKIFGWTANSGYSIKKMLRCGADGLITDNQQLARYYVDQSGKGILIEEITELFYGNHDSQIGAGAV